VAWSTAFALSTIASRALFGPQSHTYSRQRKLDEGMPPVKVTQRGADAVHERRWHTISRQGWIARWETGLSMGDCSSGVPLGARVTAIGYVLGAEFGVPSHTG